MNGSCYDQPRRHASVLLLRRLNRELEAPLRPVRVHRCHMPDYRVRAIGKRRQRNDKQRFVVVIQMRILFVHLFALCVPHVNRAERRLKILREPDFDDRRGTRHGTAHLWI